MGPSNLSLILDYVSPIATDINIVYLRKEKSKFFTMKIVYLSKSKELEEKNHFSLTTPRASWVNPKLFNDFSEILLNFPPEQQPTATMSV